MPTPSAEATFSIAVRARSRSSPIAPPSRPRSGRSRPSTSSASATVGSVPPRPGPDRAHLAGRRDRLTLRLEPGATNRPVEGAPVTGGLGPDVRVRADGREALELAVERQPLVRVREIGPGELFEHDFLAPP